MDQGWRRGDGRIADHVVAGGGLAQSVGGWRDGGVGACWCFCRRSCPVFFFVGLLETHRLHGPCGVHHGPPMSKVGLYGRSFIPLCRASRAHSRASWPRARSRARDRLSPLVAPLMSCSARLPVYALIAALSFRSVPCSVFPRPGSCCLLVSRRHPEGDGGRLAIQALAAGAQRCTRCSWNCRRTAGPSGQSCSSP